MSDSLTPVGVFGGTFNPVHYGHLRSALELCERLGLDHVRLMPCAQPPHRTAPDCSAEQRAEMVELAVRDEPRLRCDRRELAREGVSYTVLSLEELRNELGEGHSLVLVMGCDALLHIDTWFRWQALLELAHIVVIARPGWHFPTRGTVARWLEEHRSTDRTVLRHQHQGTILVEELRPLAISSTEIRDLLLAGRSPRYLLPGPVLDYIETGQFYQ